jgi:hypothetical protein
MNAVRQARSFAASARRPMGRIAAFSVLPAVSLLSNLIVLPVLSARFGQAGWSSVILGQSIGAAASVVGALAWPVEGPHLVAGAARGERLDLYRASLRQRGAAVAILAPVVVTACLLADPGMPLVCALSALAVTLNALSPGWYFVGSSRPSQSIAAEGGPRLAVNLASIGLVALLPLWTYPVALIGGMAATLVISSVLIRRDDGGRGGCDVVRHAFARRDRSRKIPLAAIFARGADASYAYLSGPLVAFVAPPVYPVYAAVDRLSQSLVNVMGTVTQGLTAWIGENSGQVRRRRVTGAVLLAFSVAGVALAVLFVTAPLLLRYLFAGTVEAGPLVAFLAAAIITGAFLSRSLVLILLVPQGLADVAYRVMFFSACLGLPAVGVAAALAGSTGALIVVAVVPWVSVVIQLVLGLRSNSVDGQPAQAGLTNYVVEESI